ncbi:hypothetical protein MMC27_004282 [Xylographa pallens]|nr:hypothetical protein [Xylographa pallens]
MSSTATVHHPAQAASSSSSPPPYPRALRLLALDGGGVRGLSELLILKRLMHRIDPQTKDRKLPKPCDYFDVMYGTSTGGLVAIMLGRLELDIDTCIERYIRLSRRIFPKKSSSWLNTTVKWVAAYQGKEWFDSTEYENCVKEVVEEALGKSRIGEAFETADCRCKVAVCVTRAENSDPAILRGYFSRLVPPVPCAIWEAARATSAASLFFAPITIGSLGSIYADGGMRNNNPIFAMIEQVQEEWPEDYIACVVSIGTGIMETKGLGSDLKSVVEACTDIVTDTEQTAQRFKTSRRKLIGDSGYFRFNVDQGMQGIGLEEHDKMNNMAAATDSYLDKRTEELGNCANLLRNPSIPSSIEEDLASIRIRRQSNTTLTREVRIWIGPLDIYEDIWSGYQSLSGIPKSTDVDFYRHLLSREPKTCHWLLSHDIFRAWAAEQFSSNLWIKGIPGCGKSVLAAFLAQSLYEGKMTCPPIIFFCDAKDEEKMTASSVFRNLLIQMSEAEFAVQDLMNEAYRKSGQARITSPDKLRKLLLAAVQRLKELTIIIDGLDELDQRGQDALVEALRSLQACRSCLVKTCVTSRNQYDMREKLSFIKRSINIDTSLVSRDIKTFIDGAVDSNETIQQLLERDEHSLRKLKLDLLRSAEGQFLLPKCLIEEAEYRGMVVLDQIPGSLAAYYIQFLNRIEFARRSFASRAFRWVAYARRPLTIAELAVVLGIQSIEFCQAQIRKVCGSLIAIEGGAVRLVHTSVQQFLQSSIDFFVSEDLSDFACDANEANAQLATCCVAYLSLPVFAQPLSGRSRFQTPDLRRLRQRHSFLLYSVRFWVDHVTSCSSTNSELLLAVDKYLKSSNSRTWLEAMFLFSDLPNSSPEVAANSLVGWLEREDSDFLSVARNNVQSWALQTLSLRLRFDYQTCMRYPAEVHFVREILPLVPVFDSRTYQETTVGLNDTPTGTNDRLRGFEHWDEETRRIQLTSASSDRFLIKEGLIVEWNSTMETIFSGSYVSSPSQWTITAQNLVSHQKDERVIEIVPQRNKMTASVAISIKGTYIAAAIAESNELIAEDMLKIRLYAWRLYYGKGDLPIFQPLRWTERDGGVASGAVFGFIGAKNAIAISDDETLFLTPLGAFSIADGTNTPFPSSFPRPNLRDLTVNIHASILWGRCLESITTFDAWSGVESRIPSPANWQEVEILSISPGGKFAVILVWEQAQHELNLVFVLGLLGTDGSFMRVHSLKKNKASKRDAMRLFSQAFANGGLANVQDDGTFVIGWPTTPFELFFGRFCDNQNTSWCKKRWLKANAGQKTISLTFAAKGIHVLLGDATIRLVELSGSNEESVSILPLSIESLMRKSNFISDLTLSQEELIVFYPARSKLGKIEIRKDSSQYYYQMLPFIDQLTNETLECDMLDVELSQLYEYHLTGEVGLHSHQLLIPSEASKSLKQCLGLIPDLNGRPIIWTSIAYCHSQRLLCYSSCVISKVEAQPDLVYYMIHLYLYDLNKDVYCSHFFQERRDLQNVTRARAAVAIHPTHPIVICFLDITYRSGNSVRGICRTLRFRFGDERELLSQRAQLNDKTSEMFRANPAVEETEIGGDFNSFLSKLCYITKNGVAKRSHGEFSANGRLCYSVEYLYRDVLALVVEDAYSGDRRATLQICQDWGQVFVHGLQIEKDTIHLMVSQPAYSIIWQLMVPRSKLLKVKRRRIVLLSKEQLRRSSIKMVRPEDSQEILRIACYGFTLIRWIEMGDLNLAKPDLYPEVIQTPIECLGAWEESDEIMKDITEPISGSVYYDTNKPGAALLEQQKDRTNGTDPELTRW